MRLSLLVMCCMGGGTYTVYCMWLWWIGVRPYIVHFCSAWHRDWVGREIPHTLTYIGQPAWHLRPLTLSAIISSCERCVQSNSSSVHSFPPIRHYLEAVDVSHIIIALLNHFVHVYVMLLCPPQFLWLAMDLTQVFTMDTSSYYSVLQTTRYMSEKVVIRLQMLMYKVPTVGT